MGSAITDISAYVAMGFMLQVSWAHYKTNLVHVGDPRPYNGFISTLLSLECMLEDVTEKQSRVFGNSPAPIIAIHNRDSKSRSVALSPLEVTENVSAITLSQIERFKHSTHSSNDQAIYPPTSMPSSLMASNIALR